ncbi:MAG: adenylosuccinate synthetase [Patescibacteria group bacterium]|nr:adenylosuccinate synthetase [Patescibacteria group bacterium]
MCALIEGGTNPRQPDTLARFLHPELFVQRDYDAVYRRDEIVIGAENPLLELAGRENTVAIIGAQVGDEGKGRVVDNQLAELRFFAGCENSIRGKICWRLQRRTHHLLREGR